MYIHTHAVVEFRYNGLGYNILQCMVPCDVLPYWMVLDIMYVRY